MPNVPAPLDDHDSLFDNPASNPCSLDNHLKGTNYQVSPNIDVATKSNYPFVIMWTDLRDGNVKYAGAHQIPTPSWVGGPTSRCVLYQDQFQNIFLFYGDGTMETYSYGRNPQNNGYTLLPPDARTANL
ncbi:MAG: hypothetical protein WCT36_02700 [Candidatus Gracilibacteria bacterium]|jgi:hypothetical protein